MIYPQESPEKWATIYRIKATPRPCEKCGEEQLFETPFAHGDARGLISSHIKCGEQFQQSTFVFISEEINVAIRGLFQALDADGKGDANG